MNIAMMEKQKTSDRKLRKDISLVENEVTELKKLLEETRSKVKTLETKLGKENSHFYSYYYYYVWQDYPCIVRIILFVQENKSCKL